MMYPEEMVIPMRQELTNNNFKEMKTIAEVNQSIQNTLGTHFVVVNSVCGCAAGTARPGALLGVERSEKKPDYLLTVFAGMDTEAVDQVRKLALPYPPSSPCMMLFKDAELVHMVERMHIEGRTAEMIAEHLASVFDEHC